MKRYLTIAVVVALVSTIIHAGEKPAEDVSQRFDSHVVGEGALLTWGNYVNWWNETKGTPLNGDIELPASLWADGVARLKPEYVYTDGVSIVIVRTCHEGNEEGFYVALSISSGFSTPNSDKVFDRMLIAHSPGGTVHTFRRRGHFERSQEEKPEDKAPNKTN